jgi:hypothetical protein
MFEFKAESTPSSQCVTVNRKSTTTKATCDWTANHLSKALWFSNQLTLQLIRDPNRLHMQKKRAPKRAEILHAASEIMP